MDQPDDIVTRLLNSDGRVNELLKEAAQYITTLRQSLVVLNNQLSKEINHEEIKSFVLSSTPLANTVERMWEAGNAS